MFLNIFTHNEPNEAYIEVPTPEEDIQTLEAFAGDTQIIMAAQELNKLKETLN